MTWPRAYPIRQISENAGEDGAVIAGKTLEKDEYNYGFDAQTGEFKDLVKAGIIDPTKVVRTALQDAASSPVSLAININTLAHPLSCF